MRPASRNTLATLAAIGLLVTASGVGARVGNSTGIERSPRPIPAPLALIRERAACTTYLACKSALRDAYQALAWTRKARRDDAKRAHGYGVQHALRLASALYGVPLAQLEHVGNCESHLQPTSKNQASTAAGLFQFLDSTWARAGVPGFSVYDPYANALAAARLVSSDGSWREWSCQP